MNGLEKTVAAGLATVALFSAVGAAERNNPELNRYIPTPGNTLTFLGNRATDVAFTVQNIVEDPEITIVKSDGSVEHKSYDGDKLGIVETGIAGYLGARLVGGLFGALWRRRHPPKGGSHASADHGHPPA